MRIIDRDLPPEGSWYAELSTSPTYSVQPFAIPVHVEYPAPPVHFSASPDVRAMWDRFARYRQGGEPLQAMAYFCLSIAEHQFPSDSTSPKLKVANRFGIDLEVVKKFGDLVVID